MAKKPTIPVCGACQFFKPAHQDFGACICPFVPKHLEREANAACVYWTSRPNPEPGRVLELRDGATPGAPQIARIRLLQDQHWISLQILDLDGETVIGEVYVEHYKGEVVTRVWDDMDGEPIHTTTHLITAIPLASPAPVPMLVEA